jgi:hypothetical protein
MATLALGDVALTSGQLAQLRAINTKYFTELYALQRKAEAEGRTGAEAAEVRADRQPAPTEADMAALDAMVASDLRQMLTEEQRAVFDRNFPRLSEREVERPVSVDRQAAAPSTRAPAPAAQRPRPGARTSHPTPRQE